MSDTGGFAFRLEAGVPQGPRVGLLETPHGSVATPAFMPVGTRGAVKGLTPEQLRDVGAEILLANAYHLGDRPGEEVVRALGGLHRFSGWDGPILTDSGGFQVLSLAELRTIDDDGVVFRSPVDGRPRRLTPETVLDIQAALGPDIAMVLDHCPGPTVDRDEAARVMERTVAWARRAARHRERLVTPEPLAVFGIQQGGAYEDLRREAAEALLELGFDGHAVGGVSVGEDRTQLLETIASAAPWLPAEKPRYLMGVGGLEEFAAAVEVGIDLFDCVIPTRNARNGHLFRRRGGPLRIKNARFERDSGPLEVGCSCGACRRYSRGFIRHLILRGERLGDTLASIHNLRVFLGFLEDAREAIRAGRWPAFVGAERQAWSADEP